MCLHTNSACKQSVRPLTFHSIETYQNMKIFAFLFMAVWGKPSQNCDTWRCPMSIEEHCGTNGVTYSTYNFVHHSFTI